MDREPEEVRLQRDKPLPIERLEELHLAQHPQAFEGPQAEEPKLVGQPFVEVPVLVVGHHACDQ